MRRVPLFPCVVLATLSLTGVSAAGCFADYKARRDSPLQLHYGVMELPDAACTDRAAAAQEINRRIGRDGWRLLTLMAIFESDGLADREYSAGAFFLKY